MWDILYKNKYIFSCISHLETTMAKQKIARRTFFAGLGAAAAAGLAVKLSPKAVTSTPAITPEEPAGDGYRLTSHIKKYYRTTTI
jgi:hypothetical protein